MKIYGQVKTSSHGKNGTHRDCPICDPDTGGKSRARQRGKKEIKKQIEENPYLFYDPFFEPR